ncbi:MAG: OB-fold nucleic acid binding domain-containing protein, partial [Chloroflexi bacterium]|nr:OB-fold nucleic acid binding domain-containing protein [Chloroflexota bacterium]
VYQEQIMRAAVEIAGYSRSESDDLRKAISKKQADKIAKHKDKFVKGASEHVMDKATATAIFEDWEKFARYGFNKSHAADYGLISVQTGYLKAHYPAEYMCALMSVFKDDSDKVSLYINDARAMGIAVLPPDINHSGLDFTIEDGLDDKGEKRSSIRYGMSAIKNVGVGPVNFILEGRGVTEKEKPFADLNDLAHRVDLKAVGKRALECLIKVGGFDSFGDRAGLLALIDRLVAASTSHFRAAESGQLSLFGGASGVQAETISPPTGIQVDKKEALNWERELIGVYLSDHPLSAYAELLTQAVSHNAATLLDAPHEERVRVAGMVVSSRPYKTKTDKMMGFVTLEDLFGNLELVIFPKTWEKVRALCENGKVLIADGKLDATSNPPKILVDEIRTQVDIKVAAFDSPVPVASVVGTNPASPRAVPPSRPAFLQPGASSVKTAPVPVAKTPRVSAPAADYTVEPDESDFDDMPPEPDMPPDWEHHFVTEKTHTSPSTPMDDILVMEQFEQQVEKPRPVVPSSPVAPAQEAAAIKVEPAPVVSLPPIAPPPMLQEAPKDDGLPPRLITIFLRPSGDNDRDRRRIKNVYGILISHPGKDRFQFQVFENGKGHLIDFPNDTTRIASDMLDRLKKLMGEETWRVEEITYQ